MNPVCPHCDASDSTLLRLILLCEILRADAATLETIAEVLEYLGLMDLTGVNPERDAPPAFRGPPHLRLVRSAPDRPRA